MHAPKEAFRVVPYLDVEALDNRPVMLQPYWDGKKWHMWVQSGDRLQPLAIMDFSAGRYYANEPAGPSDLSRRFLEEVTKRGNLPKVLEAASSIEADMLNLAATLWKLDHAHDLFDDYLHATSLARTELEYALVVCRSLLDLLQVAAVELWKHVKLHGDVKKKVLPHSFADVALRDNRARLPTDIASKWGLPDELVKFYVSCAPFLMMLRSLRDKIVHAGANPPILFRCDRGFGIDARNGPFAHAVQWNEEQLEKGKFGSLRFLMAHFVSRTLDTCDGFIEALMKAILLPQDIAPAHHVYVRGPFLETLDRLDLVLRDPWERFVSGSTPPSASPLTLAPS